MGAPGQTRSRPLAGPLTIQDLPTPALILDAAALRRNIAAMSEWAHGRVQLRPHAKIHKCAEIARLQLEAGAIGMTAATVPEAVAMADAGAEDILIANQVVGPHRVRAVAGLARHARIAVALDDAGNAEALARAARAAGVTIDVLIDIDVGMGRCGVRSLDAARSLGRVVRSLPGLEPRGVMAYEGHAVLEPDRDRRQQLVDEALGYVMEVVDRLGEDGFAVDVISAGGTNTFDMTGAHPRVTELQAGTYAIMDAAYVPLARAFEPALRIAATVVSRQGTTAVLDCGTKVLAVDMALPQPVGVSATVRAVHEEHALLDVTRADELRVGDVVELVVGYCGGTTNLHDRYYVVEGQDVVDVWAIAPRGPGWQPPG